MGVKDLWLTLAPICEKKSLWELRNKKVAIDLSVWICENQTIDYCNNNLFLRNLFFRTSYMLLLGIEPVFALEGIAPELKHDVMKQRKVGQSKMKGKSVECRGRGNRSRLNSLQTQCEELLRYMGVQCIYSMGEAEAVCASLNLDRIVDGVISKDSDCFLYGARTVYRNFNISNNGGTCDKYDMDIIEEKLKLGRNKLIALSLLCGCDYNKGGVEGVGKETALKFLSTVDDMDVLDRMSKWREDSEDTEVLSKVERDIKLKALQDPEFPFYNIQDEFLNFKYDVKNTKYCWRQPNLQAFMIYVERKLGWPADYAMEKFLPLLSRWHLLHDELGHVLILDYIVKKRNLRSVPSFQVKWKDFNQNTIEPKSFLILKYRKAVEDFEGAKQKKKAPSKKKKNIADNIVRNVHNLSFDLSYSDITSEKKGHSEVLSPQDSITKSDFECSASDLLELSSIIECIISRT